MPKVEPPPDGHVRPLNLNLLAPPQCSSVKASNFGPRIDSYPLQHLHALAERFSTIPADSAVSSNLDSIVTGDKVAHYHHAYTNRSSNELASKQTS